MLYSEQIRGNPNIAEIIVYTGAQDSPVKDGLNDSGVGSDVCGAGYLGPAAGKSSVTEAYVVELNKDDGQAIKACVKDPV